MTQEIAVYERVREIDRRDDEQIIAHMSGELVTEYVYSFTDGGGRKQEGLSWAGVRELAQLRGNIVLDKPDVEDHDDFIRVMVRATDMERNVSVWGGTHQPKYITRRDKTRTPDDFAYEKAISKAQRNAIKNLMPVTVVRSVINQLQGRSNGGRQRQSRPASPSDRRVAEDTGEILDEPEPSQKPSAPRTATKPQAMGAEANLDPERRFDNRGALFMAAKTDLGLSQKDVLAILGAESVNDIQQSYSEDSQPDGFNTAWRELLGWHQNVGEVQS